MAEVADDFKADLKDLTTNDRYAISNFTVIAKESVSHADEISKVICDHITETNRNYKLPALYVLDSIVKNIGNPYTLFISPRLYTIFMEAYCVVDSATRRKLDEMLKTWKSPVPGSTDTRPVFPQAITKRIETALMQWKAKTMQQEQEQQRAQQDLFRKRNGGVGPAAQWRNTPTPPQNDQAYPAPVTQGYLHYPQQSDQYTGHPPRPSSQNHYQQSSLSSQNPYGVPAHSHDASSLHQDTENLIEQTKADWARSPYDDGIRVRLKALLDLQTLLKTQQLPPEQLHAVRNQLSALQVSNRPSSQASQQPHQNVSQPPFPERSQFGGAVSTSAYQSSTPNPPPFTLPLVQPGPSPPNYSMPSQPPSTDFLSSLLSAAGRNQTPQSQQTSIPPPLSAHNPHSNASVPSNPLIAQLRAAGMLAPSTPPSNSHNNTPVPNATPQPPPTQPPAHGMSTADLSQLLQKVRPEQSDGIPLTSASLKQPRPHLISRLYEDQPNQCLTCGKRFKGSEDGKAKKARHLDWHFKTNQRLVEAAQRGQSRSWYVDEKEWIKYLDDAEGNEESTNDGQAGGGGAAGNGLAKDNPRNRFIPVPSDNAVRNAPCPICQEQFEQSWNEELQDFVFIDAVKVGGRIYHASCYADYRKDEANTPARNSTPDSVLGKRKADANANAGPSPAKVRRESDD